VDSSVEEVTSELVAIEAAIGGRRRRHGGRFRQKCALEDANEFHALAPLEALSCV
jgi:hypothetical protein